ncbi:hypothetical protein H2204_000582 [Knufia peltigerae]|uniref:DUF4267 domain-containing protein n=1 Tax=Knufia peltigerae TaxID=1002370 RepID=A0AA39D2E4_9EURO|nr:hypothetical protein H2204_000582 [Knufia peltigerae]
MDTVIPSTNTLPPLHHLIAYAIALMLIGVFIGCLVCPHKIAAAACFPEPADQPMHVFFYLFAVRELCLGLALLVFLSYEYWKSATILLAIVGINGISDFLISGFHGKEDWRTSFYKHGIPTLIGYYGVLRLWQDNW